MIISDLQYIESVDTSEVQGAGGYKKYGYYKKYTSANATAGAGAKAFGDYTSAYSDTFTLADANNGVSIAGSFSSASASSSYYYH